MTGREKIEAAFSPEGTPEVAAVICYEGIYVRDHWDELTDRPWWDMFSLDIDDQVAWRRDVVERTGMDWLDLPNGASREHRANTRMEGRPDGVYTVNTRTGESSPLLRPLVSGWSRDRRLHSVRPERPPDTPEAIEAAFAPYVDVPPDWAYTEGRDDLARRLLGEFGGTHFPLRGVDSPLWRCYGLWGFEGMMERVAERPDLIEYACRRWLEIAIECVEEAVHLGAAGIWLEECFTDCISPDAFLKLNLPFLRELVEAIRAAGLRSIYYFCGDPTGKWDLLLDVGADALALEESKKGFVIDIDDVADRVAGRCTVLGNLDAIHLLEHGSDDELRAEIVRQIAAGRRNGSRFIMSLGSPVTPGTSVERVRRFCDIAHELGRQ